MNYLLAFGVSFVYVFLKAMQQLNVVFGDYFLILPVSLMMAICEVTIVTLIVMQKKNIRLALAIGFGAGLGAMLAMFLHGLWRS